MIKCNSLYTQNLVIKLKMWHFTLSYKYGDFWLKITNCIRLVRFSLQKSWWNQQSNSRFILLNVI